jgi:Reeler domain
MRNRAWVGRGVAGTVLVVALVGPLNLASRAFSSGPPAGYTGAPGENTCSTCHDSFVPNSGTAAFDVAAPVAFTPSSAHPVVVSFANSGTPRHGFQVTARDGAGNPTGSWKIVQSGMTQDAAGSSFHHEHTSAGSYMSSWAMEWQAPATLPNGPVTLYSAGVEGNDAQAMYGDYVYTTTRKIHQATLATIGTTWSMNAAYALTLSAPSHAGELYWIVPSEDPTPFPLGGSLVLEVNPLTGLLDLALQLPSIFQGIHGTLDVMGQATAVITIPYHPVLVGFTLHFAAGTAIPPLVPTEVSNRISVTLQ